MPAEPIGNPGGQEQSLDRVLAFDIDVQLDHLIEGALAAGGVEDHRQRFPPGPQP